MTSSKTSGSTPPWTAPRPAWNLPSAAPRPGGGSAALCEARAGLLSSLERDGVLGDLVVPLPQHHLRQLARERARQRLVAHDRVAGLLEARELLLGDRGQAGQHLLL